MPNSVDVRLAAGGVRSLPGLRCKQVSFVWLLFIHLVPSFVTCSFDAGLVSAWRGRDQKAWPGTHLQFDSLQGPEKQRLTGSDVEEGTEGWQEGTEAD